MNHSEASLPAMDTQPPENVHRGLWCGAMVAESVAKSPRLRFQRMLCS
jgi:hypothetical protein